MSNLTQAIKAIFDASQAVSDDPAASRNYLYGYIDALVGRDDLRRCLHDVVDDIISEG